MLRSLNLISHVFKVNLFVDVIFVAVDCSRQIGFFSKKGDLNEMM